VLGCSFCEVKADYFSWCGWCRQSSSSSSTTTTTTTALPSTAVPSRPSRLLWINRDVPRPLVPLSLPFADDEAYAYHHGDASSTSPSASLRPKAVGLPKPGAETTARPAALAMPRETETLLPAQASGRAAPADRNLPLRFAAKRTYREISIE
jgi:hypothetical protein